MITTKQQIIGYCLICGEPIYAEDEYFTTIYDEVIHNDGDSDCMDEYNHTYWWL